MAAVELIVMEVETLSSAPVEDNQRNRVARFLDVLPGMGFDSLPLEENLDQITWAGSGKSETI